MVEGCVEREIVAAIGHHHFFLAHESEAFRRPVEADDAQILARPKFLFLGGGEMGARIHTSAPNLR